MAITDILAAAQNGAYFSNAAAACDITEAQARAAMTIMAPRIAEKLRAKAAADPDAFDALLDILEEGGDSSDLDDVDAMTGAEAQSDGAEILKDLYGSGDAATKALSSSGLSGPALSKTAALSATGVLAALAASNAQTLAAPQTVADTGSGGGGFFSILIAALLKGLLQGASRQLAPKRRRRRRTYYSTARRRTTKRRTSRPGLDDVFRDLLGSRR
jgi:hypothetical protein